MTLIIGLLIPLLVPSPCRWVSPFRMCPKKPSFLCRCEPQEINLSTIGFAVGFVLMMVLDVVMG